MSNDNFGTIGSVIVKTTTNRGFTVEETAEDLLNKLIFVSSESHPAIRGQALAFKEQIRPLLVFYMNKAVQSDRTTIIAKLTELGHHDMAEIIRRL